MQKSFRKRAGAKASLVLLSIFIFLFLFAPAAAAATYGDINDDGDINVLDVVLIQQHVLGLEELDEDQEAVADVNGDGDINVQDVTLIMQYSLGLIDEFPHANLQVSSVTAVNPKQVEVEFNRMLKSDERSKMTTDNFHVGLQASPSTDQLTGIGSAVEVQDDSKSVLLTMADGVYFVNGSTTNRVIVRKEVGIDADYTINNLVFVDTSVPTLQSVHTESPRTVVLTFSEPLDNTETPTNITLNGGSIALNLFGSTYVDSRSELRIDTFTDLSAGSYTLGISSGTSLKDYSGFSVVPTSKTFTHSPVTTEPTVSVKSATVNSVTIEFSRAIDPSTLVNNTSVLFRHTVETSTYYQVTGTSVSNPSGDARTFVIDFTSKTLPVGTTTLWMKYVDGTPDASKVKDTWGNIIAPFSLEVITTLDTTGPTATVSVYDNTRIDVQYSEAVQGASTLSNYSLKKDDTTISISSVSDLGGNKYRLATATQMQGQHTLTIYNIKDTSPAENPMGTQSYSFNVPDTISPEVIDLSGNPADKFYYQISNNKVRIFFNEAMNQTDLATKSMYENKGDSYANPTVATPASDGKSVYLEFAHDVTTKLWVGAVRDLAGNSLGIATELNGEPFVLSLDPGITYPVRAITITNVKVYLSDIVNSASIGDFEIRIDNSPVNWVNPANITIDNSSGKSVLTLTLAGADAIGYDAKDNDGDSTQVRTVSAPNNTKNAFGFPVTIAATTIVDRIVPVVESVDYVNSTSIKITLTEAIDETTMSGSGVNGVSVSGGTLTKAIYGAPDQIVLTGTSFTENTDVYYNSAAGITDKAGNYLASFSRTSTLD